MARKRGEPWRPKTEHEQRVLRDKRAKRMLAITPKPPGKFRYRNLIEAIMADEEHRNHYAVIATFEKDPKPENQRVAKLHGRTLRFALADNFPTHQFRVSTALDQHTWGTYQLRVAYVGPRKGPKRSPGRLKTREKDTDNYEIKEVTLPNGETRTRLVRKK